MLKNRKDGDKMFGSQVDGSLRFDTRVDSGGFNTGIRNLGNSLGRLRTSLSRVATAVGIAFSVTAVVNFGKICISTATEVENAWVGLNSIINGQGKSFDNAKKFIQEYISDGLVPLKNAVIAYKNLSLRGYSEEQIKAVMIAFKNSATYARQSQYTLGDAISTATEGLKNENSIVVDNAGVTKNVAKMWKEYANELGVSYTSLTKEQKIQAEVNGILEETKFQMNDAAKYSNTYSGQLARLSASFTNLKTKIGNILKVIVGSFLPTINNAISVVEKLADKVTALFNSWGIKTDVVDTLSSISDTADDSADSLTDTAEAAEKLENQLAGFDKLNVLKQDEETDSTSSSTDTIDLSSITNSVNNTQAEETVNGLTKVFERLNEVLQPVKEAFERLNKALEPLKRFTFKALEDFYQEFLKPLGKWVLGEGLPRFIDAITKMFDNINWDKLNKALKDFWKSLEPFAENVGEGLLWLWEEVLTPLAGWTISDLLPVFLDVLSGALDVLNAVIEKLKTPFQWLWYNFLQPVAEWTGGVIVSVLNDIANALKWIAGNEVAITILSSLAIAIGVVAAAIGVITVASSAWAIVQGILNAEMLPLYLGIIGITAAIAAIIAIIWLLVDNWDDVCAWIQSAWQSICDWFSGLWDVIVDWFQSVWDGITNIFRVVIDWFTDVFQGAWEGICSAWDGVTDFFSGIWDGITNAFSNVTNWFKNTFSKAWEAVKNVFSTGGKIFEGIKDGILSVFKNVVNGLIDGINNVIAVPFNAINFALQTIKGIEIAGFKPFEWITSIAVPQIPKLATGTVVPANYGEFAAILGDNTREPEIVSPLSTMKQAMREVMAEMNVSANSNVEYRFVAELNGKPLFEEVIRQDRIDRKRHGGRSQLGTVR